MRRPRPNSAFRDRCVSPWWAAVLPLLFACGCGASIHDAAAMADVRTVAAMLDRDPSLLEARNALGKTPLHMAVTSGSTEMVQLLLDRGANVNAKDNTGLTPLHIAAWWTATNRAQQLLDAGADPNSRDRFGDTPLHVAAMHGRQAMTVFLAGHGARLDVENDSGRTPLALAEKYEREKTAHILEVLAARAAEGSR